MHTCSRASGAGGQHVNTTDSAVRITHIPTGKEIEQFHESILQVLCADWCCHAVHAGDVRHACTHDVRRLRAGTAVSIQDERSQHKNKAKALKVLRAHLFRVQQEQQQAMTSASKQQLAGTGDRSERIRTYNFPQGRVTDHRVGHTEHNIERVLTGEVLDAFIDKLQAHHTQTQLLSLGAK